MIQQSLWTLRGGTLQGGRHYICWCGRWQMFSTSCLL